MDKAVSRLITTGIFTSTMFAGNVYADGLQDLKQSLAKLKGDSSIQASLESSHTQNRDKEEDLKTTTGYINLSLSNSSDGLQITYSSDVLEKLEQEQLLSDQDEEADTPTLNAMNRLETTNLNRMLSAASSLSRFIEKAKFIEEVPTDYQGEMARRLVFNLPLESIVDNAEVRGYVDDFDGKYTLIIDEHGLPKQSILSFAGSGSAFLFFSVEMEQTLTSSYQTHGDRLVIVQEEVQRSSSSTWADTESVSLKHLTVHSGPQHLAKTLN